MPTGTLARQVIRDAWTGDGTFATTLLVLAVDTYGTECTKWTPQTIKAEIEDDFHLKLPQPNLERLLAAIQLLTTDDFYIALPDFITLCNVLSGGTFDPRHWDPADAVEIAWGVTEALLISPPESDEPFSPEIRSYIGAVLDQEGIIHPPDTLRLALRTDNLAAKVQGEFHDDPTMFASIYQFEQQKTEAINRVIKESLFALSQQLEQLQLDDGDTKDVVQRMLHSLGRQKSAQANRAGGPPATREACAIDLSAW